MEAVDFRSLAERAPSNDPYLDLITAFCDTLKVDGPELVAAGNPVVINDVRVSIESAPGDVLSIFVEMGSPPKDGEGAVLRMLMQRNFAVATSRGPSYCVSTMTGKVLLVGHFLASAMTPDALVKTVESMVDQALEWREGYFLWADA